MTFGLDHYEPIALHVQPELMRAAEAQTAVLHPAASAPVPQFAGTPATTPTPAPAQAPAVVAPTSTAPAAPPRSTPVAAVTPVSPPTPAGPAPAPPEPLAAYLVGMNATAVLRASLADFLDAAGSRRDVRVSVGVASGRQVAWVLRDQVPYGVRALPRYPDSGPAPDPTAALAAAAAAVVTDAAEAPARRQLVVLVWDRWPDPVTLPTGLRSALVLHCVDAVLTPPTGQGAAGSSWILARARPGPQPSLLAHTGRLLEGWEPFRAVPAGLTLAPFHVNRA